VVSLLYAGHRVPLSIRRSIEFSSLGSLSGIAFGCRFYSFSFAKFSGLAMQLESVIAIEW